MRRVPNKPYSIDDSQPGKLVYELTGKGVFDALVSYLRRTSNKIRLTTENLSIVVECNNQDRLQEIKKGINSVNLFEMAEPNASGFSDVVHFSVAASSVLSRSFSASTLFPLLPPVTGQPPELDSDSSTSSSSNTPRR